MTAGPYQAFVIPVLAQELQAVPHLVDGLARAVHADADEIQSIARGGRDGGTVVGVIGGLEPPLDVDRGHPLARHRPLMGAAKLLPRGTLYQHPPPGSRPLCPPLPPTACDSPPSAPGS